MSFTVTCCAGEDHRHRVGGCLIKTVDDFNLLGMLKNDWRYTQTPRRPLDCLVIHVVVTRDRSILANESEPGCVPIHKRFPNSSRQIQMRVCILRIYFGTPELIGVSFLLLCCQ